MRQIFKEEDHQSQFIEKGYVQLPLISQKDAQQLVDDIMSLEPGDGFNPSGDSEFNTATYHCTFLDSNLEYKKEANRLMAEAFQGVIDRYLKDFRIVTANFYVKPPGRGKFTIHQNWHIAPEIKDTTLTIWCPLVDVSPENGTLKMVEGSHKIIPNIPTAKEPPFYTHFEDVLQEKYLKPLTLKAGDGVIFDDHLIHGSDENLSDKNRIAVQIALVPKEVPPVHYHLDPEDSGRFEILATDEDFYIYNTIFSILQKPTHTTHFGYLKNVNRVLTVEEFDERLKRGTDTRRKLYGLEEGDPYQDYFELPAVVSDEIEGNLPTSAERRSLWQKIMSWLNPS
jgi:hypothetical protein